MFCAECGRIVQIGEKYCPSCGAGAGFAAGSSLAGMNDDSSESNDLYSRDDNMNRSGQSYNGGNNGDAYTPHQEDPAERNEVLFYASIALLMLGIVQVLFRNPLFSSGFSDWDYFAYLRGIPWYICVVLPYLMVIFDLLFLLVGVLGISLSRRSGAVGFYRYSGKIISVASAGLLLIRIVHDHVVFISSGEIDYETMLPETIAGLQEQYSRSLYPLFIMAAIAAVLSVCYIIGSAQPARTSSSSARTPMVVIGILGFVVSLCGIFFGKYSGDGVPLVASWSAVAFGAMSAAGIAGVSKRRSRAARTIWGVAQLAVFTFSMLQTIYYAYFALLQGRFFIVGPFIWLTVLTGLFAASTVQSAIYISGGELFWKLANKNVE